VIVNPHHRFVFLAVPRTGSKAMAGALLDLPGSRAVGRNHHNFRVPPAARWFLTFAVVRNPYARLASHYRYRCDRSPFVAGLSFAEYIDWAIRRGPGAVWDMPGAPPQPGPEASGDPPQVAWLAGARVDAILRYEHLETDLQRMPFGHLIGWRHTASPSRLGERYDEALRLRVCEAHRLDFEAFGYPPELPT
jgi:hypothetical protein